MPLRRTISAFTRVHPWLICAVGVVAAPAPAHADAKSDYEAKFAAREKSAKTPAERAKLANEIMKSASGMISRSSKGDNDTIFDQQKDLQSLRDNQKDDVLFLCGKVHEIGSRQQESYPSAARALGIIQTLDPEKRIDCLTKLRKMYEDVYLSGPTKNVGFAKGFANVNLQLGDEQWARLQDAEARGKVPPAEYVATLKSIGANYNKGLDVIRSAMNTIRPYAKGKKTYEDFLNAAGEVEKELVKAQKTIAAPLAAALDLDRTLRSVTSFQARLTANPADSSAADRLVRLYLNELDDPAAVETVIAKASPEVKEAVTLLKKPVSQLTAAQALAAAQWCDKANDNPSSPNRVAMQIRTRVYCDAYQKIAKPQDSERKTVEAIAKRLSQDLARAQVSEDKVRTMAASYVEALEPPPAVAVAPAETPPVPETPEVKPETPIVPAETPRPATPPTQKPEVKPAPSQTAAPTRTLAKVKVEPAPRREPEPQRQASNTIFDFGND